MTGSDWVEGGLTPDDAARRCFKAAGSTMWISSGGITADTRLTAVANMNVQFAEKVKAEAGIATRTVGLTFLPSRPRSSWPKARPTWWRWRAPFSTIRIGAGTRRNRSAPTLRA